MLPTIVRRDDFRQLVERDRNGLAMAEARDAYVLRPRLTLPLN